MAQTDVVKHPVLACKDVGFELNKGQEEIFMHKILKRIISCVIAKVKALIIKELFKDKPLTQAVASCMCEPV